MEIIRNIEREDLLRFYDHYISPRSTHRRKIALHVEPSPLALKSATADKNSITSEDELALVKGEELPSVAAEEAVKPIVELEAVNLTEQPIVVDSLIDTSPQQLVQTTSPTKLELPQVHLSSALVLLTASLALFRSIGLIMSTSGRVNYRVIRLLNPTRNWMCPFFANCDHCFSVSVSNMILNQYSANALT